MLLREMHRIFLTELKLLYSEQEAGAITNMIFDAVASINKKDIITEPQKELNQDTILKLDNALTQLKSHAPVQYIIGEAWFYQLPFKVSPEVLIPRPETEELVTLVIDRIKKQDNKTVLEIGTGSGCIAVSIKKNVPQAIVSSLDISEASLQIAKENASTHATEIEFILMDFIDESNWNTLPVYDVMVSNPPYIPENEKQVLDKNVTKHEPHLALFVPDTQKLIFYEKIASFAKEHLAEGGSIFLETHETYANEVAAHFSSLGYKVNIQKDFFEKERIVIATRFR